MPGPGPDQPGQALPGGTPHAVRGVPGHPIVTNPAQSSSERLTWPTSVVCDNRVDGNIEIPSGGTPQDVHVFIIWQAHAKYTVKEIYTVALRYGRKIVNGHECADVGRVIALGHR